MRPFLRQFTIVFGVWTLVALCGGTAQYLLNYALGESEGFWSAFRRPLTEQWIWAALTPVVFLTARHFPLSRPRLLLALAVHVGCFLSLSFVHCAIAEVLSPPLAGVPENYHGSMLRLRFLVELYSDIWMYWPLVCIQALMDSHARTRERDRLAGQLEAELTKSRLALLRAQIQPHFLFNTLHAISALTRIDVRAAEDMVADLAEILRASFSDPASNETSLRHELALVRCYLRIQSRRFSDRLSVRYRVSPETLDAAVPVLVLQSLVENAVVHGIAAADRPGAIEIRAYRWDDRLVLQVIDDGAGLRLPLRPGVGLSNAQRRLQQLYAEQQSLDISGEPDRGVAVIVSIPFRILPGTADGEPASNENPDSYRGRRGAGAAQPVVSVGA